MKVNINGREKKLPDFLIVGAGKSGTTSLYRYLLEHPDIFLPKAVKETLFFHIVNNPNKEQLRYNRDAVTNFTDYLSLFDDATNGQLCGEVCPSYLYYHDLTIKNIKEHHPGWKDLKIIIILREPVSKIISQYYFIKNTLKIPEPSISTTISLERERLVSNDVLPDLFLVDTTKYYTQVKAYMENFKNVQILFYDNLMNDPGGVIKDICCFLGVDQRFEPQNLSKKYNVSKRVRVPKNKAITFLLGMYRKSFGGLISKDSKLKLFLSRILFTDEVTAQDKAYLKKLFEPEVDKLKVLIKNDLHFWKY